MAKNLKILVVYYSRYGATKQMAQLVAHGVEQIKNADAVIRTVPEVSAVSEAVAQPIPETGAVYVSLDDLKTCDGLALGSPTRFGNMAAPMKYFLDSTSALWMGGDLISKPASVFTSSSSMHGGQESTLLTMMMPLLHQGMIIVGLPYSVPELTTTQTGGTPYGNSHYAGKESNLPLSREEEKLAIFQGRRLAEIAVQLAQDHNK